ncbi:MAG: homoserine O-succinyltransferase [Alphaproteobacteria bacterium]|nr:homoserine O-succinyltransferase [Alphaproteobacteria bacterium]
MPIKIPDDLPARQNLEAEGMVVMTEADAIRQDIRPLRIGLLNLMPQKQKTETQIARLIGATPLQIDLTLITTGSYVPGNVSRHHLSTFYCTWDEVKAEKFDGFIVTGAPVETLPFEHVKYWDELRRIFDWTQTNVTSTLNICWGGQAALHHFYGIEKYELPQKMFGVFPHRVEQPTAPLMRGFCDTVLIPVSRHTENRRAEIEAVDGLTVLLDSEESGLCMVEDRARRQIYMFNHLEYDAWTLGDEYERDLREGLPIDLPRHYYPGDDPSKSAPNVWRSHGHLFIGNWIDQAYQMTPFDPTLIGT